MTTIGPSFPLGVQAALAVTKDDPATSQRRRADPFDALLDKLGDKATPEAAVVDANLQTVAPAFSPARSTGLRAALARLMDETAGTENAPQRPLTPSEEIPAEGDVATPKISNSQIGTPRRPQRGEEAAAPTLRSIPARPDASKRSEKLIEAEPAGAPRREDIKRKTELQAAAPEAAGHGPGAQVVDCLAGPGAALVAISTPTIFETRMPLAPSAAAPRGDGALKSTAASFGSAAAEALASVEPKQAQKPGAARAPDAKVVVLDRRTHLPPTGATLRDALQLSDVIAAEVSTMTGGGPSAATAAPAESKAAAPIVVTERSDARKVMRSLDLQLEPEALGTITVRLRLSGGRLGVEIEAARTDAARLIQDDGAQLARKLRSSGYVIDHLVIKASEVGAPTQQMEATHTHASDTRRADLPQSGDLAQDGGAGGGEQRRRSGRESGAPQPRPDRGDDRRAGDDLYL